MSFLVKVNVVFGSHRVSAEMHLGSKGRVRAQQMLCSVTQIVVLSRGTDSRISRRAQDYFTSVQQFFEFNLNNCRPLEFLLNNKYLLIIIARNYLLHTSRIVVLTLAEYL